MAQKIVINRCYGGFGISTEATLRLRELGNEIALKEVLKGETWKNGTIQTYDFYSHCHDIKRDDLLLLQVIKEFGEDANGFCAKLEVIEIPDDIDWQIEEYDGMEWVSEVHRTWH
jgi:hypothetical protein